MDTPRTEPPPDSTSGFGSSPADSQNEEHPAPSDAFREAMNRVSELREYANYYVSAKVDTYKASARKILLFAALGVVALLAACAMVVTAVVLLCVGLSDVIASAFDPPKPWVGELIIGVALVGMIFGGGWFGISRVLGASRRRLVKKYEQRKSQQRVQFGHDVQSRADGK